MKRTIILMMLSTLLVFTGCRKFDELNTDPAKPGETRPEFLLANAEKRASDLMYDGYYNGRIGMHYAQYWTGTDKTDESRNLITNDALWTGLYVGPLVDLQEISNYYRRNPQDANPNMVAVAEIMKVWIFHVLTDLYVDIPYSQALKVDAYPQPVFDRAQDVYAALITSLKTQIAQLSGTDPGVIQGDILMGGKKDLWVRFANALRMRIALRMADVKPDEARAEIEDAAKNTLHEGEDIYFPYNTQSITNRFPYNEEDRALVEFAVTTTLIDYLKEVDDPRLKVYARPSVKGNVFRGKPYGLVTNTPVLDSLSKPGTKVYSGAFKGYLITYTEVAFIKTEAAARGMNVGGSAASLYENAIAASMKQWEISGNDTINNYIRRVPYNAGNWKDVIGTQKWIALYMQGLQSWMERLRLDFNRPDGRPLFIDPVSGSLDAQVPGVPQRLNYPNATRNSNAANSEQAAANIGGDTKATRNWWNVR
ncbi:SusD/RagB family nutrient-binding outer membrane lipoprotein [Taibaiella chishuiensis]|uniref:SusD-like starch-binding protein associating with outer membrane n=1 Tax=Taibaiella chishuiensis TaxID=1434707 RepID=A0A2P8DBS0_9BACT|nr:SusD/RagB family nutrient-binding outer membrane lipoprotein [Taibaiella chishuiensis]PSK94644.1 SusD-like starch-binding protein associating with outer membrane [Taibaiella chishuiensis]